MSKYFQTKYAKVIEGWWQEEKKTRDVSAEDLENEWKKLLFCNPIFENLSDNEIEITLTKGYRVNIKAITDNAKQSFNGNEEIEDIIFDESEKK